MVDEVSLHKVSEAGDLGLKAKQLGLIAMTESKDPGASDSARSPALSKRSGVFGGSTWLLYKTKSVKRYF